MTRINLLNNALDARPPYTVDDYLFDFEILNMAIAGLAGCGFGFLLLRILR